MTVLSLTATSRYATRLVRKAGEPVAATDLIRWLEALDIDAERAQAGVRLATIVGRLEATTDDEQRPCLAIPDEQKRAA